jgi:hypothetical protein
MTPEPAGVILQVDQIDTFYGQSHVLQGISLSISKGEVDLVIECEEEECQDEFLSVSSIRSWLQAQGRTSGFFFPTPTLPGYLDAGIYYLRAGYQLSAVDSGTGAAGDILVHTVYRRC